MKLKCQAVFHLQYTRISHHTTTYSDSNTRRNQSHSFQPFLLSPPVAADIPPANSIMANGSHDLDDDFVLLDAKDIPLRIRPKDDSPPEKRLSLDLQNISTDRNEVLVSIRPPIKPQVGLKHTPCDIVLVIDVSASMNTAADLPDTGRFDVKESSGWSILDLVKHACRTIMEHLNEQDRLAVVTFSTGAKVIQGLLPMTSDEKTETSSRIEALTVQDSTNLWAGLREGLDIFTKTVSIGNAQGMYVLTDGVPNHLNPAQGFCKKLAPMLKELESDKGQAPIVSTFGFGYYLKSSLLRSIAEVGRGSYSFIPDAGMIGTVFVHAVANLFSTYATGVELVLDCSNVSATIESPAYLEFNTVIKQNTTKICLGNIQYGQSRDIIIKVSNAKSIDFLRATLHCQPPHGSRDTLTTTHKLSRPTTIPKTTIDYHVSRHDLCAFLCSLSTKSHNNEHFALHAGVITTRQNAFRELVSIIESRVLASPATAASVTDLAALLADLKSSDDNSTIHGHGQISLALQTTISPDPALNPNSNTNTPKRTSLTRTPFPLSLTSNPYTYHTPRPLPFYTRWGQHYLPSILHAHASQLAMTFKDPGPLRYGVNSPLFIKCRDELDDAFDRLDTPVPSLRRVVSECGDGGVRGVGGVGGVVGVSGIGNVSGRYEVHMSRFNRVDNPCFTGECLVRYADGTCDLRVDEIRVGDILWTAAGGRMIRGVVATKVESQELIGVDGYGSGSEELDGGKLWVTPWHPVFVGGRWVFPGTLPGTERKIIAGGMVYSFIMERDEDDRAHTVEVGGVICVTLGHGLVGKSVSGGNGGEDVRNHPFFGDYDAVMGSIERLERDDCGRRVSGGIVKKGSGDVGGGLACAFVGPDEAEKLGLGEVMREKARL